MVKIGPKMPSPSRRELERIEKENKRIAQIESGVVPVSLGEPRENLFYLPPLGKKRRVKRTEPATIEESQRKRAKKQKRALARRNAKAMVKEAIARLTAGSQAKVICSEGASADNDSLGMPASGGISATGGSTLEAPIAIIHTPLLTGSGHGPAVEANSSNLTPGWSLLKSVTKSWRSSKTVDQDVGLGLSPGIPGLDLGQNSGDNSNTLVTSTPRLDVKVSTGTESGYFFDNETFVSGPSKIIDAIQEVEVTNGGSSPQRHEAPLPSRNLFLGFVHRFGHGLEPPARFSFRAPPRASPVSKTAIFSEPLDYSKYSSKRSSSAFSSMRSQSEVVHKRAAEQPIATVSDLQCALPVAPRPGPLSLADSGLLKANLAQPLLPILSFGTSVTSKAPGASVFKFDDALEKASVGGPSIIHLGLETPPVVARVSVPAKLPFPTAVAVKDGFCAPGSSISFTPLSNDEKPPAVTPGQITAPVRMENSGVREPIRPPPIGYSHTAVVTQMVTPNHAKACEQNSGQIVNSGSFSSNISSVHGSVKTAPCGPAESLDANGQARNVPTAKSAPRMLNFSALPNLTLRPLAPAAPIIHKTPRTRIVAERDISLPRSVILSDLEKGSCGGDLNPQSTRGAERTSPLLSPTFNIRQPSGLTTCPDTPPRGSRSGIVPPASTPVSHSPRVFAIALPTAPPWSRAPILPTHGPHITDSEANGGREAGGMRGFVLALKWALKKTFNYFWQQRG